jgi:hypothetical protein
VFLVGPAGPNTAESEPNDSSAQPIQVPGSVDGRMGKGEDTDAFRFQAQAGDSLAFYVQAREAGSSLDSMLTLKDGSGKTLVSNDDFLGKDAALSFTAPASGEYVIEIKDLDSGGGRGGEGGIGYGYRILATRAPVIRTTLPLGAPAGMLADISIFGLNLGALGKNTDFYTVPFDSAQARVQIPNSGPDTTVELSTARGLSNPIRLEVLDTPDIREQEPNDETPQALVLSVPGAAHGRVFGSNTSPGGDVDRWRFPAKKGAKLSLTLTAMKAGSSLDAVLTVRNTQGEKLAFADDSAGSRDPALEFDPPADGEYVAEIAETSGGGAIDAVYMLKIRPVVSPKPDFALSLYPVNPSIPRGGSVPVEVRVSRTGGFRGPIAYELPPLPKGVTALIPPEAANQDRFYIALTATTDAPYAMAPFGLTGKATIEGKDASRLATGKERVWRNAPLRPVDTVLQEVSVCEPMDFTVALDLDRLELKPGETKEVKVKVRKIRGYVRGIPIRAATVDYQGGALPSGLSVGRVTLAGPAEEVMVSVGAESNTKPGEYTVFICALSNPTTNDYILIAHLAPPLKVVVAPSPAPAAGSGSGSGSAGSP